MPQAARGENAAATHISGRGGARGEPQTPARLLDEEAHYFYALQWHRIVPHSSKVREWTITPSHFVNNQLDGVWLAE